MSTPKHYLIVWHESDGNDCTVYDTIVMAESEEAALNLLGDALERQMAANGTSWQDDGNQLGYYFDCTEACEEACEGHGGTSLRTVEEYATEEEARNARSRYHSEWTI